MRSRMVATCIPCIASSSKVMHGQRTARSAHALHRLLDGCAAVHRADPLVHWLVALVRTRLRGSAPSGVTPMQAIVLWHTPSGASGMHHAVRHYSGTQDAYSLPYLGASHLADPAWPIPLGRSHLQTSMKSTVYAC